MRHEDAGQGMVHVPGGTEWVDVRFHHATEKGVRFKTSELFISGNCHSIFSDCG